MAGKPKLAFFYTPGGDTFLKYIIAHLSDRYEVRLCPTSPPYPIAFNMAWSDISWFDWCDGLMVHGSRFPNPGRIICRLHSYEAMTNMPSKVDWSNVDDLVFVAPHIRGILKLQIPNIESQVRTHIIPNGVDLDKFTFTEREKGSNLAYVGYINYKKAPALLLQCIKRLVDIDPRYVLHIAGLHQDLRFQLYFDHMIQEMGLMDNVFFYGWVDDIQSWLKDKHYIVCSSLLESFGNGIAEAMSCGLKPILHSFVGAEQIYGKEYLFNTVEEFAQMVLSDDYIPVKYRQHIEKNYSLSRQLDAIDELLDLPQQEKTAPMIPSEGSLRVLCRGHG